MNSIPLPPGKFNNSFSAVSEESANQFVGTDGIWNRDNICTWFASIFLFLSGVNGGTCFVRHCWSSVVKQNRFVFYTWMGVRYKTHMFEHLFHWYCEMLLQLHNWIKITGWPLTVDVCFTGKDCIDKRASVTLPLYRMARRRRFTHDIDRIRRGGLVDLQLRTNGCETLPQVGVPEVFLSHCLFFQVIELRCNVCPPEKWCMEYKIEM